MVTWETMAMLFEWLFIATAIFSIRETIIERMYGIRYKRWVEVDTGRHGSTILDKSLDKCKIMGQVKTINRKNIVGNMMFFVNDCCENLKVEPNNDKWLAYCNSEEFDTVFKNQMLAQLMLIMERNLIKFMFIIILICFAGIAYLVYGQYQMKDQLTYMVQEVSKYVGTNTVQ